MFVPANAVPYTYQFGLPKFDSDWGTLSSVTLSMSAQGQGLVKVLNASPTAQAFTNAFSQTPITISGPVGSTLNLAPTATVANGIVPGSYVDGLGNLVVGQYEQNNIPFTPASSIASISVPNADFSAYEGSGYQTANFTATAGQGNYSGTASSGVFFGGDVNAGGEVTITYDLITDSEYPAPEPGFGFLAAGLFGAAFAFKRFRRA